MILQIVTRLLISCMLLVALPLATDELVRFFQAPHVFGGVAAIASCFGACVPVLTLFRSSER